MLKITPLSVKLELPLDSVSNCSVLVCPNVSIETNRPQRVESKVLLIILNLGLIMYLVDKYYDIMS